MAYFGCECISENPAAKMGISYDRHSLTYKFRFQLDMTTVWLTCNELQE